MYQSPLWKYFHKVEVSENCRQAGDGAYGEILNRVRTGDHTTSDLEFLATRVCGTGHPRSYECILNDQSTVLCSKHDHKDLINGNLLNLLPGKGVESLANDVDLSGNELSNVQVDILNRQRSKGAPPQKLKLKVSARVVVTRNLDVTQGVVNGMLRVVENIQENLTVRRLNDSELMCITRVQHTVKLPHTSEIVLHEQFPLILAWAMIIHRTQALTLATIVFVYLDSSFFACGQAYVALSRVKAASQLHFLAFDPVSAIKTSQHVRNLYGMTLPSMSGDVHFEPVPLPSLFNPLNVAYDDIIMGVYAEVVAD